MNYLKSPFFEGSILHKVNGKIRRKREKRKEGKEEATNEIGESRKSDAQEKFFEKGFFVGDLKIWQSGGKGKEKKR